VILGQEDLSGKNTKEIDHLKSQILINNSETTIDLDLQQRQTESMKDPETLNGKRQRESEEMSSDIEVPFRATRRRVIKQKEKQAEQDKSEIESSDGSMSRKNLRCMSCNNPFENIRPNPNVPHVLYTEDNNYGL
jgi:hypothetical protein